MPVQDLFHVSVSWALVTAYAVLVVLMQDLFEHNMETFVKNSFFPSLTLALPIIGKSLAARIFWNVFTIRTYEQLMRNSLSSAPADPLLT